jgi:hypothetical protein
MFFRAICWKELIEHRLQATVLTLLGLLILLVVLPWALREGADPGDGYLTAILFVGTCGLVTGAILLANEAEGQTQGLLDIMPRRRMEVWRNKVLFGIVITTVQAAILVTCARFMWPHVDPKTAGPLVVFIGACLLGYLSLGCGLAGSSLGRTVLQAIGLGIVVELGIGLIGSALNLVLFQLTPEARFQTGLPIEPDLLAWLILIPLPFVLSGLVYTRLDRARRDVARPGLLSQLGLARSGLGLKATVWASIRQGWLYFLVIAVIALLSGPLVLVEPFLFWPVATLVLGLLMGTVTFGDEQHHGIYRFLGEQRLPIGRFWLFKVGSRLAITVAIAIPMALTAEAVIEAYRFQKGAGRWSAFAAYTDISLFRQFGSWIYFGAPLLYGFAFGQLASTLARKSLIAFAIAIPSAIVAIAIWLPSLVSGGVPAWQVYLIPVVAIVAGRMVMWYWATGRLVATRSMLVLGIGLVGGIAFLATCFWQRIREVPAADPPVDIQSFAASFPTRDQNKVRSSLYQATGRFNENYRAHNKELERDMPQALHLARVSLHADSYPNIVMYNGWPKRDDTASEVAKLAMQGDWLAPFRQAAAAPDTPMQDPRDELFDQQRWILELRGMCKWICAYALYQQSQGRQAEALDLLVDVLAVARDVQNSATMDNYPLGIDLESKALLTLRTWSENPMVPPELLEKAVKETLKHEENRPPFADVVKAEYLMVNEYLSGAVELSHRWSDHVPAWQKLAQAAAISAPWEHARRQRIVDEFFDRLLKLAKMDTVDVRKSEFSGQGLINSKSIDSEPYYLDAMFRFGPRRMPIFDAAPSLCDLRATQICLALHAYEVRGGKPANELADLVPNLLPKVPIDPYCGQDFRYRLAMTTEWITWWTPALDEDITVERASEWRVQPISDGNSPDKYLPLTHENYVRFGILLRRASPGAGIVWSVGFDGKDNGGNNNGADKIYIVPPRKAQEE